MQLCEIETPILELHFYLLISSTTSTATARRLPSLPLLQVPNLVLFREAGLGSQVQPVQQEARHNI